jgi:hypothetical protein
MIKSYDINNIINNNIEDNNNINDIIINYIENYLNLGIKIIIPSFIDEYKFNRYKNTYLHNFQLIDDIKLLINNYLIEKRNNIRQLIKINNFNISGLIVLLNDFINKLNYIDNLFFNKIKDYGIDKLVSLILSDTILITYYNNNIDLIFNNYSDDLEQLFINVKNISICNDNIIINFYNIFNIIISNNISYSELPLSNNLLLINNIKEIINYIDKYYNYFVNIKCINSYKILSFNNHTNNVIIHILNLTINKLLDLLINLFKNNNFYEIKFIFDQYNLSINKYMIFNEILKDKFIILYTEIITFLNKLKINPPLSQHDNNDKFSGNCLDILLLIINIDNIILIHNYKNLLTKVITHSLLSRDIEQNIEYLNYIIIKLKNSNDSDINKIINIIIKQLCDYNNCELVINKYYEYLIKRLMCNFINNSNKEEYYNKEQFIINMFLIYNYNIKKYIYKINKVLNDFNSSIENNNNFLINNSYLNNKLNILTTSYNCWDINQNEGSIDHILLEKINNNKLKLTNLLYNYSNYYNSKYEYKKKLHWFPHFGSIDITFNNKNIKMLPIQFMILELFDNNVKNNYNDIINNPIFSNYSNKFKDDIISSLIISKLLINNNNILYITSSNDFEIDLINIFFNTLEYSIIWEEKRQEQFVSEREDIIKANINELIKHNKLNLTELYNKLKNNIKLFNINNEEYNECINYMIKYNYIINNNNIISKIYY